jgi:glucose/arabinose dehydrogenase
LFEGRELGWPYCNADGDRDPGEANTAQRTTYVEFINDWGTNRKGEKMDCKTLTPVEQTLGAHSAPLGLSFVDGQLPAPYDRGALVGVHGSWNAVPPVAPEVSFLPMQGSFLAPQQTLVGGFQLPDGTRWSRPVAAVVGPDGAEYVTDDGNGSVYRLAPPGR